MRSSCPWPHWHKPIAFRNGANDRSGRFTQFAPRLASAGGAFDPDAWAQLFADAGAKFAGPVAEYHDGFSMLKITSLASGKIDLSTLTGVQLINNPGSYTNLSYRQDSTGLNITMPASQPFSALAYVFRLTFSGQIPAQTAARVVFHQDVNYGGTAVALGPGTYTTAQLAAAGISNS